MSEKKAKITLSGLSKGSSSNAFTSFRFSPESEEIQEIIQIQDQGVEEIRLSESAPASPKPTPGDTSPLKEYLLKEKHKFDKKWSHKWDKKSLSLDLDLKGKIKTAIEDRTKSILSNFIPEETGVIHQSQSIPENFTTRVFSSSEEKDKDSHSQSSSSSGGSAGAKKNKHLALGSLNNHGQGQLGQHHSNDNDSSSQETLDGDSSDIFRAALESPCQDVEEIGVDVTNFCDDSSGNLNFDLNLMDEFKFRFEPHELRELFGDFPTLYQPLSLLQNNRLIATPLTEDHHKDEQTFSDESFDSRRSQDSLQSAYSSRDSYYSVRSSADSGISAAARSDAGVWQVPYHILKDITYNSWTKWWIALTAVNWVLDMPFFSFICGFLCATIILTSVMTKNPPKIEPDPGKKDTVVYNIMSLPKDLRPPTKCQGFMTELEGEYDVKTCHFRLTHTVFVRIAEHNLYIYHPNSKNKIPKRRLWNDPKIDSTHLFDRQKVYNISGATITLVPDGLARKRAWNKKYPICITFPKYSVFHIAKSSISTDASSATGSSGTKDKDGGTSVNYNATAGVSMNNSTSDKDKTPAPEVEEIFRKDCSMQSLYLFARCDREKDDWFRRFINASKCGPNAESYNSRTPADPLTEYRAYMNRIDPSLGKPTHYTATDGYDNISIFGEREVTEIKQNDKNKSDKSTPSSSKKGTPEKEKPNSSRFASDFANILTTPDSPKVVNALVGRLFYDFLKSPYWIAEVQKLIDKKLFYMKKPPFIEEIKVKALDLGNSIPIIQRTTGPHSDFQGLWADLDLTYDGRFNVSLETHVNFLKLGQSAQSQPDSSGPSTSAAATIALQKTRSEPLSASTNTNTSGGDSENPPGTQTPRGGSGGVPPSVRPSYVSRVFDSDADDSGESSEEEGDSERDAVNHAPDRHSDPNNAPAKSQKIMEKIANSAFMNRTIVKNWAHSIASKPVVLSIALSNLTGTLAVNIPPPPNDRLWIGFRTNPSLNLEALPLKFGNTNINISQVTDWIRKKLLLEFQRAIVCPNMVDISINLMEFALPK